MNEIENNIIFPATDGTSIEGRTLGNLGHRVAVLGHPHPQYGGDMDNPVVMAAKNGFNSLGIATLRFNFRGVGRSDGSFAGGIGERADFEGAIEYLKKTHRTAEIVFAVYSFGAWVLLNSHIDLPDVSRVTLIAPPVSFMDFGETVPPSVPTQIIVGDLDEYCSLNDLKTWRQKIESAGSPSSLVVLEGVDHFFGGALNRLTDEIRRFCPRSGG